MSRKIIAIIFIAIGLFLDLVAQIGIIWPLLCGVLALLTIIKEDKKNVFIIILFVLSILEIVFGIIRIITNFI